MAARLCRFESCSGHEKSESQDSDFFYLWDGAFAPAWSGTWDSFAVILFFPDSLWIDIEPPSEWDTVPDVDWIEIRKLSPGRALVVSSGAASPHWRFGTVVFYGGNDSDTLFVERFGNTFTGGCMDYSSRPRFLLSSPIL